MEQIIHDILQDSSKMIFVAIVVLALGNMIAAVVCYARAVSFVKNATKVMADVINVEEMLTSKGEKYYKLSVSFLDRQGRTVTPPAISIYVGKIYKEHDKIEILSDRDRPEKIKLNKWLAIYSWPCVLGVGGLNCLIILWVLSAKGTAVVPF